MFCNILGDGGDNDDTHNGCGIVGLCDPLNILSHLPPPTREEKKKMDPDFGMNSHQSNSKSEWKESKSYIRQSKAMAGVMERRSVVKSDGGDGCHHPPRGGRLSLMNIPGNLLSTDRNLLSKSDSRLLSNEVQRTVVEKQHAPPPRCDRRSSFLRMGGSSERHLGASFTGRVDGGQNRRRGGLGERQLGGSFCTGRGDGGKRMMSFDFFNQQHDQGTFGWTRRHSLDEEYLARGGSGRTSSAVANFHEVFHQMKKENPTASMGALQQKTMAHIAELKAQRRQEERRERELQQRRDEEERLRNQTAAMKYANKWVGKIRNNHHPTSHDDNSPRDDPRSHDRHDLSSSNNSNNFEQEQGDTNDGNIFTHFIPMGTRATMIMSHRRISMDSGGGTIQSSLADTTMNTRCSSNDGNIPGGGGGANFAPRKSVGDLTRLKTDEFSLADDDTINTYGSMLDDKNNASIPSLDVSGLFVDDSEVERNIFPSEQREDTRIHEEDVSCSGRKSTGLAKTRQEHNPYRKQQQRSPTDVAGICTNEAPNDPCDALSTPRSDASDFTTSSYNGLIVGFVDRRRGDSDDDDDNDGDDDGLIVGFGDRNSQEKERARSEGIALPGEDK
mmetsp:Transcript_1450/g.3674  ORF Transcript_1450/g.3674 Transcript_1450/m.3674 type:complete len:614 (+) Transcript_1450:68-1909(+)